MCVCTCMYVYVCGIVGQHRSYSSQTTYQISTKLENGTLAWPVLLLTCAQLSHNIGSCSDALKKDRSTDVPTRASVLVYYIERNKLKCYNLILNNSTIARENTTFSTKNVPQGIGQSPAIILQYDLLWTGPINLRIVCQMLSSWTKNSPHSINI